MTVAAGRPGSSPWRGANANLTGVLGCGVWSVGFHYYFVYAHACGRRDGPDRWGHLGCRPAYGKRVCST